MASPTLSAVRQKYPQYDGIPDPQLVQMLGRRFPVYLDRDPEFRSEFDAGAQAVEPQEPPQAVAPADAVGVVDTVKSMAGTLGRAAAGSVAGLVALPGRMAEATDVAMERMGIGSGRNPDGYYSPRWAKAIEETADSILPAPNPALAGSFWKSDVPSALGSVGGILATGGTTALLRGGLAKVGAGQILQSSAATAVTSGTMTGFGAELEDALGRAKERGDDPDTALAKSLGYATVATLIENRLGAGRLLRRYFPGASPEEAVRKLTGWGVSKEIAKDIGAGFVEETSQRMAQNAIIDETLDPSKVMAGAGREGLAGAVVEGLVGAPGNVSRGLRRAPAAEAPPQARTEAGGKPVPKPTVPAADGGLDQTVRIDFTTEDGKTGTLEVDGVSKEAAVERLRLLRGNDVPVQSVMVVPKSTPKTPPETVPPQGELPEQAAPGDLEANLQAGRDAAAVEARYDRPPREMRDYSVEADVNADAGGLLETVAGLGGISVPENAWGQGEYDDLRQLLTKESALTPRQRVKLEKALRRNGGGSGIDQILGELPEAGFPGIKSAEELVAALADEARTGTKVELKPEEMAAYWNDVVTSRAGRGPIRDGGSKVRTDELAQGDRFNVMGRTMEVDRVNEDGTVDVVEVQGLARDQGLGFWGRQTLYPGDVVFPDRGTFQKSAVGEQSVDEPFSVAEQPPQEGGMSPEDVADVVRRVAPGLRVAIEAAHPKVAKARGVLRADGTVALFHSMLGSRAEVRSVLIEELGHMVVREPEGRGLLRALASTVTPEELAQMERLGYGADVAGEEAVMRRVVEADRGREAESAFVRAWRDLKAWLQRWMADRGWTRRVEDADVRELVRAAIRAGRRRQSEGSVLRDEQLDLPFGRRGKSDSDALGRDAAGNPAGRQQSGNPGNLRSAEAVPVAGRGYILRSTRIAEDALRKRGSIDVRGMVVRTVEDVAVLAQMFRDPRVESLRWYLMKDGKVVRTVSVTARRPEATWVFLDENGLPVNGAVQIVDRMMREVEAVGADAVAMSHNHPSGEPTPSAADIKVTRFIAEEIRRRRMAGIAAPVFIGHVVTDHGRYTRIDGTGGMKVGEVAGLAGQPDPWLLPREMAFPFDIDPGPIMPQESLDQIRLETVATIMSRPENLLTVLLSDTYHRARAVVQFPSNIPGGWKWVLQVQKAARDHGATNADLVLPKGASREQWVAHFADARFRYVLDRSGVFKGYGDLWRDGIEDRSEVVMEPRGRISEMDQAYLEAVNRGDLDSAERMVAEAAKAAGYNVGPMWHGTTAHGFTSFSKGKIGSNLGLKPQDRGFWFTSSEDQARQYATANLDPSMIGRTKVRLVKAFLKVSNPQRWGDTASNRPLIGSAVAAAIRDGRDGVILNGIEDGTGIRADQALVFDPEQIKSADPVVRDDAGNVIPLSQRFNSGSADMRFSLASDDPNIPDRVRGAVAPKVTSETRAIVDRWINVMPGFQGGKYQMAAETVAAIREKFSEPVRQQVDTVVDYFGGGGFWGAFLGLTSFPNLRKLLVVEQKGLRAGKIRLFHENGNRVGELFNHPDAVELFRDAVAMANRDKATSGTALAARVERLAEARSGRIAPEVWRLCGALIDAAAMGARGRAINEDGEKTAEATFEKAKGIAIRDALESWKGAEALRRRGVVIEVLNADSYEMANPAPGPRTVAVMDPPYYLTTGYDGKIVRLGTYQQTAKKIAELGAEGNGVIYTDSAWWIDAPKRVSENRVISEELNATGDLLSGGDGAMPANVAALRQIDGAIDQPYLVGLKGAGQDNESRTEILGIKVPVAVGTPQREGESVVGPDREPGGAGPLGNPGVRGPQGDVRPGSGEVVGRAEGEGGAGARPVRGGAEGVGAGAAPVAASPETVGVVSTQPAPVAPTVPTTPPAEHYFDPVTGQPRSQEWVRAFHDVVDAVRELMRSGVRMFSEAVPAMVARFGEAVRGWLPAAWQAARQAEAQADRGVTGEAQADINRILRHAELSETIANQEGAGVPVYDPEKVEGFLDRAGLRRPSEALRKFGGAGLLKAKQRLDLTTAYQQAAVRKQSEDMVRRVWESLDPAAKDSPWPAWFRRGYLSRRDRMRDFMRVALPVAAHLNVTGSGPDGWVFSDFQMRAGFMPERIASRDGLQAGDTVAQVGVDGSMEALQLGPKVTLDDGRTGFQLLRPMSAERQAQVYGWAVERFPELQWFFDLWVDPTGKGMRQTINGIEVPVFNRWSLASKYAEADPNFTTREAYTPDVAMSQGMVGTALRYLREKKLNPRAGTTSPGRKYDTGAAREAGNVQDLITGFNTRAFQVLQETARKEWMGELLGAAVEVPNADLANVPAGWVVIDKAMADLWEAFKRLRGFDDPLNFPQVTDRLGGPDSPEFKRFFGEVLRLRGEPKMLPRPVVDALVRQIAAVQQVGMIGRTVKALSGVWPSLEDAYKRATESGTGAALAAATEKGGQWWSRQYRAWLLLMPRTFFQNFITNPLLSMAAAYRQAVLAMVRGGDRQALRESLALIRNAYSNVIPGLRPLLNLNDNRLFRRVVEDVFPDEVFSAGPWRDVRARTDGPADDAVTLARMGRRLAAAGHVVSELGPTLLRALRYDKIDAIAKQQWAWSLLKAKAEEEAHRAGLRGKPAREFVERYVAKPPEAVRLRLIESANRWLLNYDDVPDRLDRLGRNPLSNLVMPFWRYTYLSLAREMDQATRLFRAIPGWETMPQAERHAALADTISWWTLPMLAGLGAVAAGALGGDPGEEDKLVGTSSVLVLDVDGQWKRKNLPRELVTANRLNVSYLLRGLGADTGEEDFWLYVKGLPLFQTAISSRATIRDASKAGVGHGVATGMRSVTESLASQFSLGVGVKLAEKVARETTNDSDRPAQLLTDPYGTGVPASAYVTMQALDLIPGQRQADELIKWLDPYDRRITQSKSLGYKPGPIEALKLDGWTGLADRAARGGRSDLPLKGRIDRRTGTVVDSRPRSLADLLAPMAGQNLKRVGRAEYSEALSGSE